jgi:hypothetical protein
MNRPRNVRHRVKTAAVREAIRRAGPALNVSLIALDYPPNQRNVPRYRDPHARLDQILIAGRDDYSRTLATIFEYADDLAKINVHESDEHQPAWINGFLPGLDGAAIYSLLRAWKPAHYFEVGSGNSTRFAARARTDGDLPTTIVSVDPHPRASINDLCDEIIREPLESQDLTLWDRVEPGDIVFMDGSHRVFMNGDVVAFFLDVLPSLPTGVLVGVHDIYLPYDYPANIAHRYYSEQYVLAAWLLGGARAEIVLPAHWVSERMQEDVERLWASHQRFAEIEHHGVAFWFKTT